MKGLVEKIVRVEVQEAEATNMTVLEIKALKHDVGALIGKDGKNINALRTIVRAAGKGKRYMVEVIEGDRRRSRNSYVKHGASGREREN